MQITNEQITNEKLISDANAEITEAFRIWVNEADYAGAFQAMDRAAWNLDLARIQGCYSEEHSRTRVRHTDLLMKFREVAIDALEHRWRCSKAV